MPPGAAARARGPRENQYIFDLGVKGRKTGLTVPDSGIRDEHGLEPIDDIFDSPEKVAKPARPSTNGPRKNANAASSSEADMDMVNSSIPEPASVLEKRKSNVKMPPPRSKSPVKTFLNSPPKRNPSLGPISSPVRGSIVSPNRPKLPASVIRRLDFSVDDLGASSEQTPVRASPARRVIAKSLARPASAKAAKGTGTVPKLKPAFGAHADSEEDLDESRQSGFGSVQDGNSYQVMEDGDVTNQDIEGTTEDISESAAEEDPKPAVALSKKRGRPAGRNKEVAKKAPAIIEEPPKRTRGQLPRKSTEAVHDEEVEREVEENNDEQTEEADERPAKKQRGPNKKPTSGKATQPVPEQAVKPTVKLTGRPISKPKTGKKRQSGMSKIESPAVVPRGPPIPRHNKGLFILRRETPDVNSGYGLTRSGRHVIKPLKFWKGEAAVYGEDDTGEIESRFPLMTIKEVHRRDEVEQEKIQKRRGKKPSRPKARQEEEVNEDEDEDDLEEPWESEPGRVYGEIRTWNPTDPTGQDSQIREEELALSHAAIITRDIPGSNFKFAKTLTVPFFGSGMVDLPPGGIKKPKNSRKMQMVFFVFSGRVNVTINENTFRIGKGGMWQVPRGNFYSIENDYEKPARIFFSQGCEVREDVSDSQ